MKIERTFKGPGFAETLYLGESGGSRVLRKQANPDAHSFSRLALCREIALLRALPETMKDAFPPVIATSLSADWREPDPPPESLWYDMPYYPPEEGWTSLSELITAGTLPVDAVRTCLSEIMGVTANWYRTSATDPRQDWVETTMLAAMRDSLDWAERDPGLKPVIHLRDLRVNGIPAPDRGTIDELLTDSASTRDLLMPRADRALHGDFFPENMLYNTRTGRWLLLDPVSVRGVFRGDVVLDLNKMAAWLAGELPALRRGLYDVSLVEHDLTFGLHNTAGPLSWLGESGLGSWYCGLLGESPAADILAEEPGWEHRWLFVTAFYSLCMLPLVEPRQALARYALAMSALTDFIEEVS